MEIYREKYYEEYFATHGGSGRARGRYRLGIGPRRTPRNACRRHTGAEGPGRKGGSTEGQCAAEVRVGKAGPDCTGAGQGDPGQGKASADRPGTGQGGPGQGKAGPDRADP